jgi:hypothetical protein
MECSCSSLHAHEGHQEKRFFVFILLHRVHTIITTFVHEIIIISPCGMTSMTSGFFSSASQPSILSGVAAALSCCLRSGRLHLLVTRTTSEMTTKAPNETPITMLREGVSSKGFKCPCGSKPVQNQILHLNYNLTDDIQLIGRIFLFFEVGFDGMIGFYRRARPNCFHVFFSNFTGDLYLMLHLKPASLPYSFISSHSKNASTTIHFLHF